MKGNAMPGSRAEPATYSEAFSAWDRLPREVRHALMYAIVPYSATNVLRYFKAYGQKETMRNIDMSEGQDIREAAALYRQQTGSEYPHVAAKATILRG